MALFQILTSNLFKVSQILLHNGSKTSFLWVHITNNLVHHLSSWLFKTFFPLTFMKCNHAFLIANQKANAKLFSESVSFNFITLLLHCSIGCFSGSRIEIDFLSSQSRIFQTIRSQLLLNIKRMILVYDQQLSLASWAFFFF